jgi:hypothetical protein
MEEIKVLVDDAGFTRVNPEGHLMHVAIDWEDMGGFEDFLVERLTKG